MNSVTKFFDYVRYHMESEWQPYYRYGEALPKISTLRFAMIYDSIWIPAGVYQKLSGFVSAIDFIRAAVEVQSDQRFEDVRYILKDLSEVTGHTLTPDSMADLAVIYCGFQSINPNCRIVFVCQDENLTNVIKSNLTSQKLASHPVEVMRTVSDAKDWLGRQFDLQNTGRVRSLIRYW